MGKISQRKQNNRDNLIIGLITGFFSSLILLFGLMTATAYGQEKNFALIGAISFGVLILVLGILVWRWGKE